MNIFGRMNRTKTDGDVDMQDVNLDEIFSPKSNFEADVMPSVGTVSAKIAEKASVTAPAKTAQSIPSNASRPAPMKTDTTPNVKGEDDFGNEDFSIFSDRPEWDEIQGFLKSIQETSEAPKPGENRQQSLDTRPALPAFTPITERVSQQVNQQVRSAETARSVPAMHSRPSQDSVQRRAQALSAPTHIQTQVPKPAPKPIAKPEAPLDVVPDVPAKTLKDATRETEQLRDSMRSADSVSKTDITKAQDYVDALSNYSRRALEQSRQTDVRLRGLSGVLGQIELKLAKYGQLEAHLATTRASNQKLRNALDTRTQQVQALELKVKSLEPQYLASRKSLELARQDLATQRDVLIGQKEKLNKFNKLLSRAATRVAETDSQYGGLVQAYKILQTECRAQATDISNKVRAYVELKKETEVLQGKLELRTSEHEKMARALTALKTEYTDVKRRLSDSTSAFENSGYEFRSQVKLLKNQLVRRTEESRLLKIQVQNLKAQSEEEGGLSAYRERELRELKEGLEAERERVRIAELRSVDKAHLADMNGRALERAKLEYEVLNEKYATALSDVEMLRSMALTQNEKLARFATLSGTIDTRTTAMPASHLSAVQARQRQNAADAGSFDPGFSSSSQSSPQSQIS